MIALLVQQFCWRYIFIFVFLGFLYLIWFFFSQTIRVLYDMFLLLAFKKFFVRGSNFLGRTIGKLFNSYTRINILYNFCFFPITSLLIILINMLLFPWLIPSIIPIKLIYILILILVSIRVILKLFIYSLAYWAIELRNELNINFRYKVIYFNNSDKFFDKLEISYCNKEFENLLNDVQKKIYEEYIGIVINLSQGYLQLKQSITAGKSKHCDYYIIITIIVWLLAFIFC